MRSPALDSGRPNVVARVSDGVVRHAVVGRVDAIDVVAVEEVERFPDELQPRAADRELARDARVERDERLQAELVARRPRCDVVASVAVAVEIDRADARRVRLPGLRGEDQR